MDISKSSAELFDQALQFQIRAELPEALALWNILLRRGPPVVQVCLNHGVVCLALGQHGEALDSFQKAGMLRPEDADIQNLKGTALQHLRRMDEALLAYQRAIALNPGFAEPHYNCGTVEQALGRLEAAVAHYDRAIALDADQPRALVNRGLALVELRRPEEAMRDYDRAIALSPDEALVHFNRSAALLELKRPEEALRDLERAQALAPEMPHILYSKAICHLLAGRFETGWPLYKSRGNRDSLKRGPFWLGETPLQGKTLLIRAEQGLGDVIQFSRYALVARDQGANPILAVPRKMMRLLSTLGPDVKVVDEAQALPDFDYQARLASLPMAFGTRQNNIPAPIPYLKAEPGQHWAERIGDHGFKIGVTWQCDPKSASRHGKPFALAQLAPLAAIPGVRLISLQKHDGVGQLQGLAPGMTVEDLGDTLDAGPDAFVDTAAVMQALDLVITCDTSIAHLAGALGRPVWVALKYVPDWRWQLDRDDSPWYPGMRLFRQPARGDWASVFAAMRAALLAR